MDKNDEKTMEAFDHVALVPDIVTEATRKNCQDPIPNLLEHLPEHARRNVGRKLETAIQDEVCRLSDAELTQWKQNIRFTVCAMPYVCLNITQANRSTKYLFSRTKLFYKEMMKWLSKYPHLPTNPRYHNDNKHRAESLKSLIDSWCTRGFWFAWYSDVCVEFMFDDDRDLTLEQLMSMDPSIDFVPTKQETETTAIVQSSQRPDSPFIQSGDTVF